MCMCVVQLTYDVVPEADGAEGDEGEVEAFDYCPALNVAEEQRRDN